jgi:hypothetical protein
MYRKIKYVSDYSPRMKEIFWNNSSNKQNLSIKSFPILFINKENVRRIWKREREKNAVTEKQTLKETLTLQSENLRGIRRHF